MVLLEMRHPTRFRRDLPDVFGIELAPRGGQGSPEDPGVYQRVYPSAGSCLQAT